MKRRDNSAPRAINVDRLLSDPINDRSICRDDVGRRELDDRRDARSSVALRGWQDGFASEVLAGRDSARGTIPDYPLACQR
ncbi:hypothetical protein LCGC14_2649960, partial [marine sediment metagenome]